MLNIYEKIDNNKFLQNIYSKYSKIVSYINFPAKNTRLSFFVFMLVTLIVFAISVNGRYNQYDVWKMDKGQYFYNDTPMMTTLDAYKYTRHAKELNAGEYVPGGNDINIFYPEGVPFYDPAPLLSVMLAKLHNMLGIDYYNIAINMVPWLSSLFILAAGLYFYLIGYPALGLVVGILTTFAPVFYGRTAIGRFDTDGGNMFFLFLASLFVLLSASSKKKYLLYVFSALLGLTLLGFQHFYNHILFNFVYFVVFVITLAVYKFKLKEILIALGVYILFSNPIAFIDSLQALLASLAVYIPFLPSNLGANSPIPWVYNTISEASAEPLSGIIAFTVINPLLFFTGLTGGIIFFIANVRKTLPLTPILAMGFVVFVSAGRFAMFLIPVIAMGLGYILYIMSYYFVKSLEKYKLKFQESLLQYTPLLFSIFLVSGMVAGNLTAYGMVPRSSIDTSTYKLISELKDKLPENATIYTWWDYGLAITDITGFPVYHSGMSQSTPKTWMIAKSLTSNQEGLYNIASYVESGGYEEVSQMLEDNKSIEEIVNTMVSYDKGPKEDDLYILFTIDMIQKYSPISYIAEEMGEIMAVFCIESGTDGIYSCANGIGIDENAGKITAGANQIPLSNIYYTKNGSQTGMNVYSLQQGYTLIMDKSDKKALAYVISPNLIDKAFVKLFLLGDYNSSLFTPVINNYPYGIVYKVNKKAN